MNDSPVTIRVRRAAHIQNNMRHHEPHNDGISPSRNNLKSHLTVRAKSKWKENLREECLGRAKIARRERLKRVRLNDADIGMDGVSMNHVTGSGATKSSSFKRGREGRDSGISGGILELLSFDHTCALSHPNLVNGQFGEQDTLFGNDDNFMKHHNVDKHGEGSAIHTAKALVERELQRALTGLKYCQQVHPLEGVPCKKSAWTPYVGNVDDHNEDRDIDIDRMELEQKEEEEHGGGEDEYKISEQELIELLHDVTEELQREGMRFYCDRVGPLSFYHRHIYSF